MSFPPDCRHFDITYNREQDQALLTFQAFSESRPDDGAMLRFVGGYCELQRSSREHLIFRANNKIVQDVLRKAAEIRVNEVSEGRTVWTYPIKRISR